MSAAPRVLVVAEAANPEWVSVPLVGWSHARAVAEQTDAHLVTHVRNRGAIERAGWTEGVEFTAIDSEAIAAPLHRLGERLTGGQGKGWTTLAALGSFAYPYFEQLLWKHFEARLKAGEFDLVHRITPLTPTAPSPLARKLARIGVPFVLGPLNGGVPWPREFQRERRAEREWLSYVRDAYKLLPGYRATRRHAAAIVVGSGDTLAQLPAAYRDKAVYLPENAIDPARFSARVEGPVERPLRLVFVGRLVPYKCADILLEAATELVRAGEVVVDVIGDGPQMPALRRSVEERGLEGGVELAGWIEHGEVPARMARSDVLAFPSIREFGGGVVLEAMALGLVPVIVDYAGPAELVTAETGFKIPLGSRDAITRALRERLEALVAAPQGLREMGERARRRVLGCFTWEAKARQTRAVYDWVLGRRPDKPDFGMPLRDPR